MNSYILVKLDVYNSYHGDNEGVKVEFEIKISVV